MPGHKHASIGSRLLTALWGDGVFASDFSEMGGIDYLHAPTGPLLEAQRLAARTFGADHTFFLVNGSTAGNQASILATVREGERVLVPRASHRSVFAALILTGAVPVYAPPSLHPTVAAPLATDLGRATELARGATGIAAVHLTSPTYYGTCSDVARFAALAHELDAPLLVDEAHGAHFGFDPSLPTPALAAGADLSVQSVHKTLGSLTQSSLLHARAGRVPLPELRTALSAIQSSSPSALLLASLDAVRAVMEESGRELVGRSVHLAAAARRAICDLPGLWCYGDDLLDGGGVVAYDATKLLVRVSELGLSGYEAARLLERDWRVEPELRDPHHVLFTVTFADTEQSIDRLITALRELAALTQSSPQGRTPAPLPLPPIPEMALTPRAAAFATAAAAVPLHEARGRVSAEMVIPYPPGIPALMPGEVAGAETIDYLSQLAGRGASFVGVEDASLATLRVLPNAK